MEQLGYVVIALAAGVAIGAAAVAWRARHQAFGPGAGAAVLDAKVDAQAAELRRLADAAVSRELTTEQLRQGLDHARRTLETLSVREEERRQIDAEQREVVRRVATVLTGGASKGRPGENVLRDQLAALPPGLLRTDVRVGGKVVEFALALPDGRWLPVDSKWTGLAELEALEEAQDPVTRDACARAVEKVVVSRAKEVAQYLDPAVTSPVAVAAVPDAAFVALKKAHGDAYAKGVVLVPYSQAMPILLFLYTLVQRFGDAADVQAGLAEVGAALEAMSQVVESRFAKAATMLANGTDEFRSQLGRARGSIARTQRVEPPAPGEEDASPEGWRPEVVHGGSA
jgi:DNA recombination protein RmuC